MNAYELADCLGKDGGINDEAANMLRQQADRIAELEKCIEFGYKDAMDIVVLNNLGAEDNHWFVWAKKLVNIDYTAPKPIEKPLYTTTQTKPHPKCDEACMYLCTAKPLSDEEINGIVRKIAKYEQALQAIANDYHELSDHKIEVQNCNYKKWARAVLSEKVSDCKKK